MDEHTEEEAALYVLGLLPPVEATRFEAAMVLDPEIAELVGRLETGAAALGATVPPREPPAELRARIMAQVQDRGPASATPTNVVAFKSMTTWVPWALAAGFAVLAGFYGYEVFQLKLLRDSFVLRDHAQQEALDAAGGRNMALEKAMDGALATAKAANDHATAAEAELGALKNQVAELQARDALSQIKIATLASMAKNAPQAVAVVAWDGSAQRGILKTLNVPAARADQDYQLWIIDPGNPQPVSAGVFDPAAGAKFAPLHPIRKVGKFAVSLEQKGGSNAGPKGPIVLIGDL